jgi:hypothetical protein
VHVREPKAVTSTIKPPASHSHAPCVPVVSPPQELIKFAYDEKIVLMADEVYQENIYQDARPFVSARKVCVQGVGALGCEGCLGTWGLFGHLR